MLYEVITMAEYPAERPDKSSENEFFGLETRKKAPAIRHMKQNGRRRRFMKGGGRSVIRVRETGQFQAALPSESGCAAGQAGHP